VPTKTLATLTIFLALFVPPTVAGDIVLLVDSSTAMWSELDDGTPAIVAVRNAVSDLVAVTSASPDVRLGMRWLGSKVPRFDDHACSDTTAALPVAPADLATAAAVFEGALPTGSRPLVLGIVAAADDFPDPTSSRRIVLITSGDDECSGDRSRAVRVLGSGVELRIVGVQLEDQVFERFSAVAAIRNATTTDQLAVALRWATLDTDGPDAVRVPTTIRAHRSGSLAHLGAVRLVNQATNVVIDLEPIGDSHQGIVPPGRYTATVIDQLEHRTEFGPVTVASAAEAELDLQLDASPPVTLEAVVRRPSAGDDVWIQYWGAPEGTHWVAVAPAGAPLHGWIARAPTSTESGEVLVRLPVAPQPLEIRFVERIQDGMSRIGGRLGLVTTTVTASLDVPAEVSIGDLVQVAWQGPGQPGDHLSITAEGADPSTHTACVFVTAGNTAWLQVPPSEGRYVVRYISGLTGRTLADGPLQVFGRTVTLSVPDRVTAGAHCTVYWGRPRPAGDYLLVSTPDSDDDDYLILQSTGGGDRTSITAPSTPGRYELRYVHGEDDEVLGRALLDVVATRIDLNSPATVTAGTRFTVQWQGPAGPGDIIAVAPIASGWRRRLDWVYATPGRTADLAAPFEPGRYEVRYVSTSQRTVLARTPLTVK
jgi:Ca-activated chloride channel family protein